MEVELSDSVDGQLGSESACSSKEEIQEHFNNLKNASDIPECSSDDLTNISVDSLQLKQSQKSVILAKKRLQAYTSKYKPKITKDKHIGNCVEYAGKQYTKKPKKVCAADDAAKAVIRDIEELKKAGFGGKQASFSPLPMEGVTVVIKPETKVYSTGTKDDQLFKKREIKCRNIRKSEIDSQSLSPSSSSSQKNIEEHECSKKETKQYPKNWQEYFELNLNPEKDAYLKTRLFKKPKDRNFNLKQYFNFETPSVPIEIYRYHPINGDPIWIPYSYLRATIVEPQILYSTNHKKTNSGYLRRDQLFALITPERKEHIEQLYKTSLKVQADKKLSVRKWYPKNWKKFDHSEGKLLESSIGLSFLQTYSDEDEDDIENSTSGKDDGLYTPPLEAYGGSSISVTPEQKKIITNNENKVDETQQNVDINEWNISKITDIELSQETESIEDEYDKTKKELEKLEAALKDNKKYLSEDDNEASNNKEKNNRSKKDMLRSSDEKNIKKKNKTKKLNSKKDKRKDKVLSDTISDSSDTEKLNKTKKKKKKLKKEIKKKEDRRDKKHKSKAKKKKKSNYESEEEAVNSDISDNGNNSNFQHNKQKQNKHIDNLLNTPPEILPPNSQDSIEEDIMYFTNRFSQERIHSKNKNGNMENISENMNKNKGFINLEELMCSTSDDIKITNEKSKSEYKVDLLKKNEEYLKNQERQRTEQKLDDFKGIVLTEEVEETRNSTAPLMESQTLHSVEATIHENQPDWEEIKNKRKKHMFDKNRDGDPSKGLSPVSSKIEDSIDVIVKQETSCSNDLEPKKPLITKHFSSSWESDEEPLEISSRNDRVETKTRESSFSLEIPLNIKHFTRRDIKFDPDKFDLNLSTVNIEDTDNHKNKRKNDNVNDINDCNVSKKKRWDIKLPEKILNLSAVKVEKVDDMVAPNEVNVESQDKLEDEYEEFLKAVTSTKKSHEGKTTDIQFEENTNLPKAVVSNLDELMSTHTEAKSSLDNSNTQSMLVNEQSALGPVPSPKIETVLDFNKPLINLSVSANVTQNITLSLATTATNISAPITSTIDISKTSLKITNDSPCVVDKEANVEALWSQTGDNIVEPTIDSLNNFQSVTDDVQNPSKQKILFTSLTLPTKKQLVNTSLLNLDESDSEDRSLLEEKKRKKLEAHIEDNKREIAEEKEKYCAKDKESRKLSKSPDKSKTSSWDEKRETSHRTKRDSPKRRRSPIKRRDSPVRRRSPGRRRSPRRSPRRRLSPRRRSPSKRSASPLRRRKSISPRRRRTPSPRRRHTISPKDKSPKRHTTSPSRTKRSSTPRRDRSHKIEDLQQEYHSPNIKRPKSPSLQEVSSSLDELKRSVADSTISDDQLPESTTTDDFNETVEEKINEHEFESPRRISLDDRINQVLGYDAVSQSSPKTITSTYNYNTPQLNYQYNKQYNVQSHVGSPALRAPVYQQNKRTSQSCYKQVGNMLQIVPSEDIMDIPMPSYNHNQNLQECTNPSFNYHQPPPRIDVKPQILQVGNMLHIVPTEIVPTEMIPQNMQQEIKQEIEHVTIDTQLPSNEKPSAETALLQKVAERRAEREKRRQEKENRRKEKEQRRKEKQKARTDRLKVRTENLIKKALELEQEEDNETVSEVFGEKQIQWPPPLINHTGPKEVGKGILLKSGSRKIEDLIVSGRRMKTVQFADGIKPGEGTSPSAGEELSSPPPPKNKLPKEKRYKKTKFHKKTAKKKVKVKVIKKPVPPPEESDSEDNLPPPSPPPGSPPPHIFPPRIKVNSVNNVPASYLTTIMQTPSPQQPQQPQQQFQSNVYRLIMAPPPPPQGHASGPSPVVQTLSSNRLAVSPVPSSHHASQTHYPPPSPSTPNSSHHHHHSLGPFGHSRHY